MLLLETGPRMGDTAPAHGSIVRTLDPMETCLCCKAPVCPGPSARPLLSRTRLRRDMPGGDNAGSQHPCPHSKTPRLSACCPGRGSLGQKGQRGKTIDCSERTPRSCRKSQVHPHTASELTSFKDHAYMAPTLMSRCKGDRKGRLRGAGCRVVAV